MTHVLVVDDNPDNLYLLRALLQGHGMTVAEARHGIEALAKAGLQRPDLVISDLLMPVMDGYTLLRRWKSDPDLSPVPFVVYTATYTDARDEQLARDLGADAFIVKPAEPEPFLVALRAVLAAAQRGELAPAHAAVAAPAEMFQAYNTVLVNKLEEKAVQLEQRLAEREQALRALRASETRYSALVEHSMDMIMLTSPDGTVHAANPAACRAFGMTEAQLCQAGRAGLVDTADPRLPGLIAQRAASGHASGELTMIRGDGTRFPVELSSTVYRDALGAEHASLIVRDISLRLQAEAQRRELEAQLRDSQKMEAIGTLASGIAHDFNNVVGAVLGNVALARHEVAPGSVLNEYLNQIDGAARRARSLVQRILSFGRREPSTLARLELQPLIAETLALLHTTLPAGVTLQTRLAEPALHVLGDATQLQQVLLNLCINAWQALGGGSGRIEIGLTEIEFGAGDSQSLVGLPPGRYARLSVMDSGCGMDDATRARVFEPFFTTKPMGQGTGLGLAVAYRIVGSHRGAVTVASQPGQGSTFHLYLPLAAEHDPAATAAAPPPAAALPAAADGGGRHVLYVDDDETMTLLASHLLGRAGYRVSCFEDARAALAAVRAQPQAYDVVVTDLQMPYLSGLELARQIKLLRAELPLVVSSGHIDDATRSTAAELGVSALLNKERLAEDLVHLVQHALAGLSAG